MKSYQGEQTIKQLEKRKGGYYYLRLNANIINQFSRKRATRMICTIDEKVSYRCGLNHLGDGNFFIIVAGKYLDALEKELGDQVHYQIEEDPDQLGVDMPEVLAVFLEQEPESRAIFNKLTDGKKRSIIYQIIKIKDIDAQIRLIRDFLTEQKQRIRNK
ncbi:YdeI/OmpD-associated family protein [Flagellimonas meridianipacifica]|uniref:Bacteriocin resistance YdeI/OmpD-like protein n=1 Tax=Flagellimonas meridianipacifica TaxID=1080225 RepID=A0A2T0MFC8_9FLAO|nr:YdeI/OmpD-associated family protein [Allomuricauda pacifica]PRX56278.1 bacteriocin resistance YdeI/OmpD-like protein [Allomuricauda pacifica]